MAENSDSNLWAAVAAFFSVIGLIVILLKPNDSHVRFYAIQSALFTVVIWIVTTILTISIIGLLVVPVILLIELVGWLVLIWKAFKGEHWKMPVIGDFVEKNFMK